MKPKSVFLKAETWSRDSHGLFDYETTQLATASFEVAVAGCLVRFEENVTFLRDIEGWTDEIERLLHLTPCGESRFCIAPADGAQDLWLVVRYAASVRKGLALKNDDVVKFGRACYRVKALQSAPSSNELPFSDTASSGDDCPASSGSSCFEGGDALCRICYDRESFRENPLFCPCRCDGSVKFTHVTCLKKWIRSKVIVRASDSTMTYQWRQLECELCKAELPLFLKWKGTTLNLMDFERPRAPFIILEEKPFSSSSLITMHVISFREKSAIRLGRGHDSDVRITDISVSRCQAEIRYEQGEFILGDLNSKFGSLIKVREAMEIREDMVLQSGRSLIRLQSRTGGSLPACGFREFAHQYS